MIFAPMRNLETERLRLRKFEVDDAPQVFRNYANNPNVTKYLTWPTHSSVEGSYGYTNYVVKNYETGRSYEWAIVPKDFGEVIGSISIVRIREEKDDVEIGYCIGEAFWHQGITSEALQAVLGFVKKEMKPKRIFAVHDVNNPHSGDVMKKCGMKFFAASEGYNNQGLCTKNEYEIILKK